LFKLEKWSSSDSYLTKYVGIALGKKIKRRMQPEQTFKFTLERPSYPYRTVLVPWSHEITQRREAKRQASHSHLQNSIPIHAAESRSFKVDQYYMAKNRGPL